MRQVIRFVLMCIASFAAGNFIGVVGRRLDMSIPDQLLLLVLAIFLIQGANDSQWDRIRKESATR